MNKKLLFLVGTIFSLSLVFGSGWHTADEIVSGNFSGNYNFIDGKIGIGTSSPAEKLQIDGAVSILGTATNNVADSFRLDYCKNCLTTGASRLTAFGGDTSTYGKFLFTQSSSDNSINRNILTIDEDGNVGIGTTLPSVALDVEGSIEYTGTITDVSDKRLKENFEIIENPLKKVNNLTGYTFNMLNETTRNAGLIAQDVQEVLPEAVSVIDEENHLGVDYTQIVPLLVESIKELNQENGNLKDELCEKDNSYSWC